MQRLASFCENEKNVRWNGLDVGPGHGLQAVRGAGRRQRNSVTIGPITARSIWAVPRCVPKQCKGLAGEWAPKDLSHARIDVHEHGNVFVFHVYVFG